MAFERWTIENAALLHFTSSMEERCAWTYGLRKNSVVIPRSIHVEEIPPSQENSFRDKYPELGRGEILLFLGRLHPIKRLDILAEAFRLIAAKRSGVRLVIAGPDDGAGMSLRSFFRQANIADRVLFTGQLSSTEKWAALRDSSIFLLPSEHENFGVSALEAMAVGVPVLISDQVGLAPSVADAHAGWVLERNPNQWADAVEQLLDHSSMRQKMGEAGRRLVSAEFSTDRIASRMHALYEDVVRETRHG